MLLLIITYTFLKYGKETEDGHGEARSKSFRYPPILPVVYYEGKEPWTADLHLRDRILMNDFFKAYIPDFTYKVVRCHDYTNRELLEKEDEMSLLMLLGKAQTPEDMHQLAHTDPEKVGQIVKNAPEHIVELFASTVWNLCMKMNVPQDEAAQYVGKVRKREMGYWFENMEKMDIQQERLNTAQARSELMQAQAELEQTKENLKKANIKAEQASIKLEQARVKAEQARVKAEQANIKAEQAEIEKNKTFEDAVKSLVEVCRSFNASPEQIISQLMEKCSLDRETAALKTALYSDSKN